MLLRQIKDLEEKDEKREDYIKGIEKQLRHITEENEKMQSDATKYDREIYIKMRELERDLQIINE